MEEEFEKIHSLPLVTQIWEVIVPAVLEYKSGTVYNIIWNDPGEKKE